MVAERQVERGGQRVLSDVPVIPIVPYVFLLVKIFINSVGTPYGFVLIRETNHAVSYYNIQTKF